MMAKTVKFGPMNAKSLPIIFVLVACVFSSMVAQEVDTTTNKYSLDEFKQSFFQDYEDFKAQANSDFERFLSEAWSEYMCYSGLEGVYSSPKPENLPAPKTFSGVSDVSAPYISLDIQKAPSSKPSDSEGSEAVGEQMLSFRFYGRRMSFHFPDALRVTIKNTRESEVAQYYSTMQKKAEVKSLQQELEASIHRLGLNEYGYFLLLRSLSEKAFSSMNERVLFCFYMLHSHGYKARIGRGKDSGQFMLLLAIDNSKEVYTIPFFRFNGVKYYTVYGGNDGEDAYSYNEKADDASLREIGLDFHRVLNLTACDKKRVLPLSKVNMTLEIPYSTSNLRYYDDLPMTVFPIYVKTGISLEAQKVLSQVFDGLGKQYNKAQLVEIMLNFVQTSFAYKIDEEQFGREKYFFPEEVVGYPYSDCEDRCALFAWLVRTYAQCEVVGILYEDHLATGVCLGSDANTKGLGFDYQGRHYMICDPTYPNASVGTVISKYERMKYEIVGIR